MSHIIINNQKIPWSFVQKLRGIFGGDWERTIDAFWKARHASGQNAIMRYIVAGLLPDEKGRRYTMYPSKEWNAGNKHVVLSWWEREVYKPKNKSMASMKEALRELVEKL